MNELEEILDRAGDKPLSEIQDDKWESHKAEVSKELTAWRDKAVKEARIEENKRWVRVMRVIGTPNTEDFKQRLVELELESKDK